MRALSIASSGLAAASTAFEASAVNVAHLASDATPLFASAEELTGGGVRVTLSAEARALAYGGASGVDLVREMGAQIVSATAYRANLKTIESADAALNTLLEVRWGKVTMR
jgi:flagellar basal body rod protein FlgC